MNTAFVDIARMAIEQGAGMPMEYKLGLGAAGLIAGLICAIWRWRRKKKET